nr:flagellar basal body P-ring formation chaperone FlgA [uncultured Roseateles sp.]
MLLLVAGTAQAQSLDTRVLAFARQALLEQAQREGLQAPELQLRVATSPKAKGPAACAAGWQFQMLDTRYLSRLRVGARCPGADSASQDFVLRAELSAEVLVAAATLPSGRPLAEADLRLERRELAQLGDALSDTEAARGLSPRSTLRAGQPLLRSQLVEPLLIKRGEAVRIMARNGGIEVHASGEALDAGRRNETVRVRNSSTGRIIAARVLGPGLVEPAELAAQQ